MYLRGRKGFVLAAILVVVCVTCLTTRRIGISLPVKFLPQGVTKNTNVNSRDQQPQMTPLSTQKAALKNDQTTSLMTKDASYTVVKHGGRLDTLEHIPNNLELSRLGRGITNEGTEQLSSRHVELNTSFPQTIYYPTTPADTLSADIEQKARIKNLISQCSQLDKNPQQLSPHNMTDFYYSKHYDFAYCKVPKSGSTFWMKLFMILLKGDQYSSIMSKWSRADIHLKTRMLVARPAKIIHDSVRTVIVSRNPYTRLYSAYIDKVFLPLFWERFSRMEGVIQKPPYFVNSTQMILKGSKRAFTGRITRYTSQLMKKGLLERRNISARITPYCANNATFEQFISFAIVDMKHRKILEPHWSPIHRLCHPCMFNTFKIVKQENFSQDVEHTLRSVNIDLGEFPSIHDTLYENRAQNSIPGIISVVQNRAFARNVGVCISQQEIVTRVWKSLQIQGFIRDEEQVPESLLTGERFSKYKVTSAVLNAIKRNPMTAQEKQRQRHLHLVNAYKTVSKDTIEKIQSLYRLDFLLFNYSVTPPS